MSNKPASGAFCHLNPALIPEVDADDHHQYDEYGFRRLADGSSDPADKEEEHWRQEHRTKWIEFLEREYKKRAPSSCLDMSQFDLADNIQHQSALDQLISNGIPNDLRPFFWVRFSRALRLKIHESQWTFTQLADLSANERTLSRRQAATQVLPDNVCFRRPELPCPERLRRILRMVRWYRKTNNLGHQQQEDVENNHGGDSGGSALNLSLIGAYLLLVCSEEDAFWLLLRAALGIRLPDCIEVAEKIMDQCCPLIPGLLRRHEIDFRLVATHWFSSLLAGSVADARSLYHLWDLYFYEGPVFLVQITIGLLITQSRTLEKLSGDSKEFFNTLSNLPLSALRTRQQIGQVWRSGRNIVSNLELPAHLYHYERSGEDLTNAAAATASTLSTEPSNNKNVRQTALIMRLHDAIVAIGNHFQAYECGGDEKVYRLEPDYDSVDRVDASQDLQNRLRPYRRRAKALIDFVSDDDDELPFAKNDLITIINEKDEHCWTGELNGRIGWFPAKFVQVLDERRQDYCMAGDDRVVPFVNHLVRGKLGSSLKAILTYGLRQSYFVAVHPWTIIEQISTAAATNADLKSVYSRLVLTKTFGLDEYARMLSPGDLLYRSIAMVNRTHRHCAMDIKLRSLICLGLNQCVLHDWFELICAGQPSLIAKWYGADSFLASPAWKLIKAELKLLVQFSFHLDPDAELPTSANGDAFAGEQQDGDDAKSPVTKGGVCDMLVKYHLFSWDI